MDLLVSFGVFGAVALLAAISPGPDFLIVSKNALSHSRTAGIWTALGVGCALILHTAYTVIGIGLIISKSILLFSVIKTLGAVYLIWLGIGLLRDRGAYQTVDAETPLLSQKSHLRAFREGFLTNALNPKATVFFVSIFTQFVAPTLPPFIQALYGLEVALVVGLWFVFLACILTLAPIREKIRTFQHKVMQVMGFALIAVGVKVAFDQR